MNLIHIEHWHAPAGWRDETPIRQLVNQILDERLKNMATKQEVLDAIEAERAQVQAAFKATNDAQDAKTKVLEDRIAELIAAGTASPADLDELLTGVRGIYNDDNPVVIPPVTVPPAEPT